jgi:hypothetical protein
VVCYRWRREPWCARKGVIRAGLVYRSPSCLRERRSSNVLWHANMFDHNRTPICYVQPVKYPTTKPLASSSTIGSDAVQMLSLRRDQCTPGTHSTTTRHASDMCKQQDARVRQRIRATFALSATDTSASIPSYDGLSSETHIRARSASQSQTTKPF